MAMVQTFKSWKVKLHFIDFWPLGGQTDKLQHQEQQQLMIAECSTHNWKQTKHHKNHHIGLNNSLWSPRWELSFHTAQAFDSLRYFRYLIWAGKAKEALRTDLHMTAQWPTIPPVIPPCCTHAKLHSVIWALIYRVKGIASLLNQKKKKTLRVVGTILESKGTASSKKRN